MKTFLGIPAHPLLVHVPAVLLPMAALGVIVMVLKPAWHHRYRWAVLGTGFVGTVGAVLAASAGESLGDLIVAKKGQAAADRWDDHVQFGETARLLALVFFVMLALYVLVPWFIERRAAEGRPIRAPKWLSPLLAVLVLVASAASVFTVIQAGHSGAKAVWCETMTPQNCDN